MTNDELLELVQKDRPYQCIHEVINFDEIEPGSYKVSVIMDVWIGGQLCPYPETVIYPMLKPGTNVLNLPHYD